MGILGSMLAGAAEVGGRNLADFSEKAGLNEQLAQAQAARDARLHESAKDLQANAEGIRQAGRASDVAFDTSDDVVAAKAKAVSGGILGTARARAQDAHIQALQNTQDELDRFQALAPAKRQEVIDTKVAELAAMSTPEALKATRAIALANHIVDPNYTLVPNADGTMNTYDSRSGKSTGVLKSADGTPIVRKDPEEMKAAVSVINMANSNLRIAEAAYKADSASLEPGVKEKSAVVWADAQREAKQLAAPAYAVLYQKAKIPGVADAEQPAPQGKTGWDSTTGDVFKNGAKVGSAKSAADASKMIHTPAAKGMLNAGGASGGW